MKPSRALELYQTAIINMAAKDWKEAKKCIIMAIAEIDRTGEDMDQRSELVKKLDELK